MQRRQLLTTLSAAGLSGCATRRARVALPATRLEVLPLVNATVDRVFRITVCSRPFRASGPRLDVEKIGETTVIHNYGHGGSGWSLSWGSGRVVVDKALAMGAKEVAVVGCGALGITAATLAQRAGLKVTIYAKDRFPDVRSARATGSWTPDSRIALASKVAADFPALWEQMTRYSFQTYQSFFGLAGNPVEYYDRYFLMNKHDEGNEPPKPGELDFASYRNRIRDILPRNVDLEAPAHPFPTRYAVKGASLTFNIAALSRQLVNDFFVEGGKFERREFRSPQELAALPEKVVIHSTGYGARALFADETIVPVRGQIAWLLPQPELRYCLFYNGVFMLPRRDGIVVQAVGSGEMEGYNDPDETPNRKEAEDAVNVVAGLMARMKRA
jgi:glycine/D-amino acid oxidase-like deaminating enzyme